MKWKWPFTPRHIGPPDETTQDRKNMIADQRRKLRSAQRFVGELAEHDRVNHYAQRLRRAAALSTTQEGTP